MMDIALGKSAGDVVAVNRTAGIAITDDDVVLRFVRMLDSSGDETDAADEAAVAVARHPAGTYWVIDLRQFDEQELH